MLFWFGVAEFSNTVEITLPTASHASAKERPTLLQPNMMLVFQYAFVFGIQALFHAGMVGDFFRRLVHGGFGGRAGGLVQ